MNFDLNNLSETCETAIMCARKQCHNRIVACIFIKTGLLTFHCSKHVIPMPRFVCYTSVSSLSSSLSPSSAPPLQLLEIIVSPFFSLPSHVSNI